MIKKVDRVGCDEELTSSYNRLRCFKCSSARSTFSMQNSLCCAVIINSGIVKFPFSNATSSFEEPESFSGIRWKAPDPRVALASDSMRSLGPPPIHATWSGVKLASGDTFASLWTRSRRTMRSVDLKFLSRFAMYCKRRWNSN